MAFLFSGLMLSSYPDSILGYFFIAIGASTLIFTVAVSRYMSIQIVKYIKLLFLKCAMVLVDAIRIYWCFMALDITVDFSQASTFVISGVLGSAVSIVPAGLGVREYVSAGIAPIIGIAASAGFLTATLNRVVGLCGILPLAGILILMKNENAIKRA